MFYLRLTMKIKGKRKIKIVDGKEKIVVEISPHDFYRINSTLEGYKKRISEYVAMKAYYKRVVKAQISKIDMIIEKLTK